MLMAQKAPIYGKIMYKYVILGMFYCCFTKITPGFPQQWHFLGQGEAGRQRWGPTRLLGSREAPRKKWAIRQPQFFGHVTMGKP